jgi:methionyl-tRNA formyltransferase
MKFAAFGRTHILYNAIQYCVKHGHEVVLVGTCPAAPEYSVKEHDFQRLAEQLSCPFFNDPGINQPRFVQMVKESKAEIALSINWLTLIGHTMLSQFKYGVVNAHAGDLPRYRGNACPNWAILAGEDKVVLSLHQMTTELDAGQIFLQKTFPLSPTTYIGDVYRFIEDNVPHMFLEVLELADSGMLEGMPQPEDISLSLRTFPRLPRDSEIDWSESAETITRLVRASAEPFSGAYTYLDTEKVVVWRAHPARLPYPYLGMPGQVAHRDLQTGEVTVLTGEGVLVLEEAELLSAGRKKASEIIRSTRARLGMHLTTEITELHHRIAELEKQLKTH